MAIQTETVVINGTEYKHTWSSEGYVLKRNDGKLFVETYDQLDTSFTYTETTEKAKQSLMARLTALETSHNNLTNKHDALEALPHIVETGTSDDGLSWYKLYSDNCCIQRGYRPTGSTQTISLLKSYKDNNYTVVIGDSNIGLNVANSRFCKITTKSTDSFTTNGAYQNGSGSDYGYHWITIGFID